MRRLPGLLLFAALASTATAQQAQQPEVTVREGGVSEALQSIFISPVLNAPFSAVVHTEWVKTMADGGSVTMVNQRRVARDSRGRIFQERSTLAPKGGKTPNRIIYIQIVLPDEHIWYDCALIGEPRTCTKENYDLATTAVYKPETRPTGTLPNNAGYSTHEELGPRSIEGIDTIGTRDSVKFNPGVFGNDQPLTLSREFWFAPGLSMNVLSEVSDPRVGKQTFSVTDINIGEPDAKLFEVPDGFTIEDHRRPPTSKD